MAIFKIFVVTFIYINLINIKINAARILAIFPIPSISHQVVFRPLTQELARRGHELVILTTDPAFPNGDGPINIKEIDVHDISYEYWRRAVVSNVNGENNADSVLKVTHKSIIEVFDIQMNTSEVSLLLNDANAHFDLILSEAVAPISLAVSIRFKTPIIQISSLSVTDETFSFIGAPIHPFLYPDFTQRKSYNFSTWEKIKILWEKYQFEKFKSSLTKVVNEIIRKHFGDDSPGLQELEDKVDMLFLNVNPIWDGNRPVPPGVVYMGGLHVNEEKQLPENLKQYFDSSVNGVIYISFGTNVNPELLPKNRIKIMTKVLARLPYDVLWKWNGDVLPDQPKNVRISKWLPQSDLLKHPHVKLFITQGGLQSTDEAITAGVPLLGIPMFIDQWYNAEKYVRLNIGKQLDLATFTEADFEEAITTLLSDKSYRENVVNLRKLIQDQPKSPLERAVWWTEYVIRHKGARHFRSPAANMSWSDYLELDVIIVLGLSLFTALVLFCVIIYYIVFLIWNKTVMNDKYKIL